MSEHRWMVDGSEKRTIDLDLIKEMPKATRLERELDLMGYAVEALLGLPEFKKEARNLLDDYEDVADLLDLYESYRHRGAEGISESHTEIAYREKMSLGRAQALVDFSRALERFQSDWGMAHWRDGAEISVSALSRMLPGFALPIGLIKAGFRTLKTIHLELRVRYSDHSRAELEGAIFKKVMEEVRRQDHAQGRSGKRLGPARNRDTTVRNLEWYFLHARGRSYREVMVRWNELHPGQEQLDITSETHLNRVKQGRYTIRKKYCG